MPSSTFYLLFLLPAVSLCEVTTFTNCPQFFFKGTSPTILPDQNRYKQICQCLLGQNHNPVYFYATLYDTQNKIPVYSAYELHHADVQRKNFWFVEPQLDGGNVKCMATQGNISLTNLGKRQALNSDYAGSGYDKGHLFPVYHTNNEDTMKATSTLTNAAPQNHSFNCGKWRVHEKDLVEKLKNCKKAFIVTGVIPGNRSIGNNVSVAEYYWNAYCCLRANNTNSSRGYRGHESKCELEEFSVEGLEARLKDNYGVDFHIFNGCNDMYAKKCLDSQRGYSSESSYRKQCTGG